MENLFTVQDQFSVTVARYVTREMHKGKDPMRVMGRMMVSWLLNALKRTPREESDEIRLYLMGQIRLVAPKSRRKRAAVVNEMRNTLAMAIINKTDYKGARAMRGDAKYKLARRYVNARGFSAGLHQAGFMAAVRSLRRMGVASQQRVTAPTKTPKYRRHDPGDAWPYYSANELRLTAMNFAKVIEMVAPGAFEGGAQETERFFAGYLMQDMLDEQNKAGLNAKST